MLFITSGREIYEPQYDLTPIELTFEEIKIFAEYLESYFKINSNNTY